MMAKNEKIIYVYDSFTFDEPTLLGKLYVDVIKNGEIVYEGRFVNQKQNICKKQLLRNVYFFEITFIQPCNE